MAYYRHVESAQSMSFVRGTRRRYRRRYQLPVTIGVQRQFTLLMRKTMRGGECAKEQSNRVMPGEEHASTHRLSDKWIPTRNTRRQFQTHRSGVVLATRFHLRRYRRYAFSNYCRRVSKPRRSALSFNAALRFMAVMT